MDLENNTLPKNKKEKTRNTLGSRNEGEQKK